MTVGAFVSIIAIVAATWCCARSLLGASVSYRMAQFDSARRAVPIRRMCIRKRALDIRTRLRTSSNAPVGFRFDHLLRVFQPGHFHG